MAKNEKVDDLAERATRLKKVEQLRAAGVNPYPVRFSVSKTAAQARQLKIGTKNIRLAGRITSIRAMGKLAFSHLQDSSGKIQIVFKEDELAKGQFQFFNENFNLGDFIGVSGELFKTKKGEISLLVKKFELLTKAVRPLPEKWHGLKDQEQRYRKRYLDLVANTEVRDLFKQRTNFIKEIRSYLDNNDFLEVETPVLEHVPGGADAEPFVTHHNTLDIDLYLRISLELHLKRLLVGGYERIYELGKVFRNEGMSTQHLQEFTMLEFYAAYLDFNDLMDFCEKMYKTIIKKVIGTLKVEYQGKQIDFGKKWEIVDYRRALIDYTGIDIYNFTTRDKLTAEIKKQKLDLEVDKSMGLGRVTDQLYKKYARPKIVQPTFLIKHPISVSPLAKKHPVNPFVTERFQIIVDGAEVGNGFSELNDPIDQRRRFESQMKLREQGDNEAQMIDEDYIEALEYGMPPAAGFGVGIDRLFMILTNQPSIRDVVFFPTMKPKK
ncbi:MAG: lysine--tRNA ligase [Candidatus Buchananbacteria bacterium CG10_big_fil_rev_8_21_14_0_10_42_9]|uniref:Lysine--tRNA ligase n=1 Tax=Candidatus Buchananbacteria bacterium CG10_big_fil_rev_8_21_14_0_10_42_9 TaxID=1974526 RepID=A0A2H0W2A4_9BACT|nr:MAG: lysine--tRNA ligase [Candidatus Buchananbacteria bacterium CG10_big_fil_rev_8_21_14_0_10_42_9]